MSKKSKQLQRNKLKCFLLDTAGSGACQIPPSLYKFAMQPPDLENTVKSTFSTIYERVCDCSISKTMFKEKINKNSLKTKIKRGKLVNYDVIILKNDR